MKEACYQHSLASGVTARVVTPPLVEQCQQLLTTWESDAGELLEATRQHPTSPSVTSSHFAAFNEEVAAFRRSFAELASPPVFPSLILLLTGGEPRALVELRPPNSTDLFLDGTVAHHIRRSEVGMANAVTAPAHWDVGDGLLRAICAVAVCAAATSPTPPTSVVGVALSPPVRNRFVRAGATILPPTPASCRTDAGVCHLHAPTLPTSPAQPALTLEELQRLDLARGDAPPKGEELAFFCFAWELEAAAASVRGDCPLGKVGLANEDQLREEMAALTRASPRL